MMMMMMGKTMTILDGIGLNDDDRSHYDNVNTGETTWWWMW